jgi:RNA polymerase sigma-70 factor (ECF subfamily)
MTPQTLSLSRPGQRRDPAPSHRGRAEESAADQRCLRALRQGDESAFIELTGRHHVQMVRVARCYVGSPIAAEEVARDAWRAALRALDGVDERVSPRLWLFRILTSAALLRARRDGTTTGRAGARGVGPAPGMDPCGRWASPPARWGPAECRRLEELGEQGAIDDVIAELPLGERLVMTLRDACRWNAGEVAHLLAIPPDRQRTLLHAGRRRLHAALTARLRPAAA